MSGPSAVDLRAPGAETRALLAACRARPAGYAPPTKNGPRTGTSHPDQGPFRSVRLLRSHCNREHHTAHLVKLRAQAGTGRVWRERSSIPACAPASKRLSAGVNAAIVADYAAKMPVRAIARKYRVNECTVHHRLKRAGVMKRPYAIQPNTIEEIPRLHAKGRTNVAIAPSVGVSGSSAHNVLKKRE